MAKERDELLDHDYDGIREYNNPLPGWWLWLFYGTIVFAVIYIPYYYLGFGPTAVEEYTAEIAEARQAAPAAAAITPPGGQAPAAAAPSMEGNADAIAAGKALFAVNCLPCHGPEGQGGIGPNLTDKYWIHGGNYGDVVNVITNGVPEKGMIAWRAMLNPEKIGQAAAFVKSLQGTNPPNPKEPQGEPYPN